LLISASVTVFTASITIAEGTGSAFSQLIDGRSRLNIDPARLHESAVLLGDVIEFIFVNSAILIAVKATNNTTGHLSGVKTSTGRAAAEARASAAETGTSAGLSSKAGSTATKAGTSTAKTLTSPAETGAAAGFPAEAGPAAEISASAAEISTPTAITATSAAITTSLRKAGVTAERHCECEQQN